MNSSIKQLRGALSPKLTIYLKSWIKWAKGTLRRKTFSEYWAVMMRFTSLKSFLHLRTYFFPSAPSSAKGSTWQYRRHSRNSRLLLTLSVLRLSCKWSPSSWASSPSVRRNLPLKASSTLTVEHWCRQTSWAAKSIEISLSKSYSVLAARTAHSLQAGQTQTSLWRNLK